MSEKLIARVFESGATRNSEIDPKTGQPKLSYAGFFCPLVLRRRAEYMNRHRLQEDGSLRSPRNWKRGLPPDVCLESLMRHVTEVWLHYEENAAREEIEDALCGVLFNAEALLRGELMDGINQDSKVSAQDTASVAL